MSRLASTVSAFDCRRRMGQAGGAKVEAEYDVAHSANEMRAVLEDGAGLAVPQRP